jgi:hypothetical protein
MERAFSAIAKERATEINAYIDANTEAYHVKPQLWKAAGMKNARHETPYGTSR